MNTIARSFLPALLLGALLCAGCGASEEGGTAAARADAGDRIALDTRADSLAMRIYQGHGGPQTWRNVPALGFTFAAGQQPDQRVEIAQHWWNRETGDYRVEWNGGPDSAYTAVFNVREFDQDPPTGRAALNGTRLDSAAEAQALRAARHRFANDTYWLLAPVKLFNDGVHRAYAADSSGDGFEVLQLSFDDVGITPDDRYWLTADSTGRLDHWAFHLEGMAPDAPPAVFRWTGYETFATPAGPVTLATRKESASGPNVVYTDEIETPGRFPDSLFSIK